MRMTRPEFLAFAEAARKRMGEITQKKNADYTGTTNDPFANFRQGQDAFNVGSAEIAVFNRMMDKFSRCATYISKGVLEVEDEAIENDCLDLANLSIILMGLFAEKARMVSQAKKLPADSYDNDPVVIGPRGLNR